MSRRKRDWKDWVLIILVVIIIGIVVSYWHFHFGKTLEYKDYERIDENQQPKVAMNKEDIITTIKHLTSTNYKIVWRNDIDCKGMSSLDLFENEVFLNENLNNNDIVWTLTHEILHKKLYASNERFIQFETFKTLYESGIKYFQDVALWRASIMWKGDKEYDCTWYVVQYLDDRDINVLTIRK